MENQISKTKKQTVKILVILLLVTTIVKYIEFLFIRTDQTIIADNVITKIVCIIATLIAMKIYGLKLADIGLKWQRTLKYIGCSFCNWICGACRNPCYRVGRMCQHDWGFMGWSFGALLQ